MKIDQGDFVEARGRPWLVEAVDDHEPGLAYRGSDYLGLLLISSPIASARSFR